ncbi:GtrA family protein [Tardiphaga sp. 172_B4_N1_3]|jgi:putative flippase GtrA|uniref:GtrA family protein n=1 Tax=Tardiphaga sp. 172_B4_N1_3 TaxID=3240787 RepID=UPI003F890B85
MIPADRRRTAGQFARFLIVGLLNTAFGYLVYAAGIFAGLAPELALFVTVVIAVGFNYMTTGRLVFRGNGGGKNFLKFALAYLVIYGFNVLLLRTVLAWGIHPLVAQALVLPPVVIGTFLVLKLFVFRSSPRA